MHGQYSAYLGSDSSLPAPVPLPTLSTQPEGLSSLLLKHRGSVELVTLLFHPEHFPVKGTSSECLVQKHRTSASSDSKHGPAGSPVTAIELSANVNTVKKQ